MRTVCRRRRHAHVQPADVGHLAGELGLGGRGPRRDAAGVGAPAAGVIAREGRSVSAVNLPAPAAGCNLERAAARIRELLQAAQHAAHHDCGITRRPCRDCRLSGRQECFDPVSCGITDLCRPCAATWRGRIWRRHQRFIREYHVAIEGFVDELAGLDQRTGAALLLAFRRMARRDARRLLCKAARRKEGPTADFRHQELRAGQTTIALEDL